MYLLCDCGVFSDVRLAASSDRSPSQPAWHGSRPGAPRRSIGAITGCSPPANPSSISGVIFGGGHILTRTPTADHDRTSDRIRPGDLRSVRDRGKTPGSLELHPRRHVDAER